MERSNMGRPNKTEMRICSEVKAVGEGLDLREILEVGCVGSGK